MTDKVKTLGELHVPGNPLILFNIWDAGSAKAVADAGAKAIATGSWGVAGAHGYKDGETFPVDLVFANLAQILNVTDLPVTLDFSASINDINKGFINRKSKICALFCFG